MRCPICGDYMILINVITTSSGPISNYECNSCLNTKIIRCHGNLSDHHKSIYLSTTSGDLFKR